MSQAIDLAVLDVVMPGMDGISLCAGLKERDPELPVLMLTSLSDAATHRRASEAGADDFLTKPVHQGELLLRVRSLLLLRHMKRELSRQNDALRAQRDDLMNLTAQKHQLMEIVIHDLKNPLAAIASNASFLETGRAGPEDVKDAAAAISRASTNMLNMIQNLLDVAREEEVGITPHFDTVDLAATVEKTTALMQRRASDRKLSLTVNVETRDSVWVDGDYMRRVLENLLDNALRYTPSGGAVHVSLRALDGEYELSVRDTGPGVPESLRERIFDKYAQLDREVDRSQQRFGRGLGLTFCRLVAEAHRGRIWVEDAEPKGARFCLRFPALSSASRPTPA
jgi:signal transduction histidine kinase